MLAAIINSHSHFYLSACSPSTPTEAGPGLQAGDTAASMTQGRRAEAPSGPGAGVTPPPHPCLPSLRLPLQLFTKTVRHPLFPQGCLSRRRLPRDQAGLLHSIGRCPGLGGWCLGLVGTLASPSASVPLCVTGEVWLGEFGGSPQRFPTSGPLSHKVHQPVFGMGLRCHAC